MTKFYCSGTCFIHSVWLNFGVNTFTFIYFSLRIWSAQGYASQICSVKTLSHFDGRLRPQDFLFLPSAYNLNSMVNPAWNIAPYLFKSPAPLTYLISSLPAPILTCGHQAVSIYNHTNIICIYQQLLKNHYLGTLVIFLIRWFCGV